MGDTTKIAWTTRTYNPYQGCVKVSEGCTNCYMFRDMERFGLNPNIVRRSATATFNAPLRWQREVAAGDPRRMVFLASWTDFFIAEADEWRPEVWAIIRKCPDLIFQILTKRHGRIEKCLPPDWGDGYPNVWLGVTAENREWWDRRVGVLRDIPAHVRFVSYEPAIGSIKGASAAGIHQVIIGGESAPGREFDVLWADEAIDICRRDGAAPFVKQLGSFPMERRVGESGLTRLRLKDRHGADPSEWAERLRVREFPV
jgi:protein gp37